MSNRRQRNNISRMPWEHRRIVCRMLFEGSTYEDIRAALVKAGQKLVAHNNSIQAYGESDEYADYAEQARDYRKEMVEDQMLAAVIKDGDGPASLNDLATYAILQELNRAIKSGAYDPRDLVKLSNAVANQSRAEIARAESARRDQVAALEAAHEAEVAGLRERIATLESVIAEKSGSKSVDGAKVADALDSILGVKK